MLKAIWLPAFDSDYYPELVVAFMILLDARIRDGNAEFW